MKSTDVINTVMVATIAIKVIQEVDKVFVDADVPTRTLYEAFRPVLVSALIVEVKHAILKLETGKEG